MKNNTSNRLDNLFAAMQTPAQTKRTKATKPAPASAHSTATTQRNDRRTGGRPRHYAERILPATISIAPQHLHYLDALADGIATHGNAPCGRSEIVRAIVEALIASGLPLASLTSAEQLSATIRTKLQAK